MAEVSWRLGSGVNRLAAFKNNPICSVSVSGNCASGLGAATAKVVWKRISQTKVAGSGKCEFQPVSSDVWPCCCKLECNYLKGDILCMTAAQVPSRLRENVTIRTMCSSRSVECSYYLLLLEDVLEKEIMHNQIASYPLPASTQPSLHVNFLGGRMRCWSNKDIVMATTFHPTHLGSPQQPRTFSTTIITVSTQRSEGGGLRFIRSTFISQVLQPSTSTTRPYSWRGSNTTSDTPPLYRSKTAYYDILRVTPHATQNQIKTAYYKQSFIYHPDKNPDNKEAAQRFADISEAYSVLGSIGLRKKYDCGILSESDVRGAGRPSTRDTASSKPYGPQQQHQQQQQPRSRRYTHAGGKTATFDFDAFFQAHYGEQLRREREIKARKERLQDKQKEDFRKWKQGKMMEMTVAVLLATGGMILLSFISS